MAITLRTKVQPTEELLTKRQLDTLDVIGLGDEPVAEKFLTLHIGARALVNHNLFSWQADYNKGSVGTIIKVSTCKDKAVSNYSDFDIFSLELDAPAEPNTVVLRSRWELEAIA